MLEINNLTFSYDGKTNVLDGVSCKLESGQIYCLLGVNGAGKTTLFNCLTGYLQSNLSLNKNLGKEQILYVQDKMSLYYRLTGQEFIEMIFKIKDIVLDQSLLRDLVLQLNLGDKINEYIYTYSLGTKQKLVLIIGFLLNYEYIFMDEPFAVIDFISAEVVIDFLRGCRDKNNTIVVSTHQIDVAQEISDYILFLNQGKVHTVKNRFGDSRALKQWIRGKAIC